MEAISISVSGGTEEYVYMYCQVHALQRDRKMKMEVRRSLINRFDRHGSSGVVNGRYH